MACCCYRCKNKTRKSAALIFKREELVYDIKNLAFIIGDTLDATQQHTRHLIQDICEAGNVDRATRVLSLAHRECVEMLYPYTHGEIPADIRASDDRLTAADTFVIFLSLPQTFSLSSLEILEPAVHEYMICRVLADWLAIVYPDAVEQWAARCASAKETIEEAGRRRYGRARLRLSPPW